jgi:hypothetical protein
MVINKRKERAPLLERALLIIYGIPHFCIVIKTSAPVLTSKPEFKLTSFCA